MKVVYICSPCRGMPPWNNRHLNLAAADHLMKIVAEFGHVPIAPHVFYQFIFDEEKDPEMREAGLRAALRLMCACDCLICHPLMAHGMRVELEIADRIGLQHIMLPHFRGIEISILPKEDYWEDTWRKIIHEFLGR